MSSKQQQAKAGQGYRDFPSVCGNCSHYSSDMVTTEYKSYSGPVSWTEEKRKRCGLGDFAVKKNATCNRHELREAA